MSQLSADHAPDFVWKIRHLVLGGKKSLKMMKTDHRKLIRGQNSFYSFPILVLPARQTIKDA